LNVNTHQVSLTIHEENYILGGEHQDMILTVQPCWDFLKTKKNKRG